MKLAKLLFALCVAAFYAGQFLWLRAAWYMLPWWAFVLALGLYFPAGTFAMFLAGMDYERGKRLSNTPELATFVVKLLYPWAALCNAGNNILTMTVVCLDPPRWKVNAGSAMTSAAWVLATLRGLELATTKRMNRYGDEAPDWWLRLTGAAWRKALADFVRSQLLDWADPDGVHR